MYDGFICVVNTSALCVTPGFETNDRFTVHRPNLRCIGCCGATGVGFVPALVTPVRLWFTDRTSRGYCYLHCGKSSLSLPPQPYGPDSVSILTFLLALSEPI